MGTGSERDVPIRLVLRSICVKSLLIATVLLLLLGSCASTGHVRKCDGRRGQRVPMGVL